MGVDSLTFTTFLVTLAMEGLCNKYGDSCNLDRQNWSILRNKRYMGKLQRHTIQQRAKMNKIEEMDHFSTSTSAGDNTPKLHATIALPKILNKHQLSLEINEDRL